VPRYCRQFVTLGHSRSDRDMVLMPAADRVSGDGGDGRRGDVYCFAILFSVWDRQLPTENE